MNFVANVIADIVNEMVIQLDVYSVEVGTTTQVLKTKNTQYLNTGMKFSLGATEYTVLSFVPNVSITVDIINDTAIIPDVFLLDAPYYIHGKYEAVNKELAHLDTRVWNPLLWLLELTQQSEPQAKDSALESNDTVRIFLMIARTSY